MPFQDIIDSTKQWNKLVLIQDEKGVCSSLILNEFVKHHINQKIQVHILFSYDEFIMEYPENAVKYYHSHDAHSWLCMENASHGKIYQTMPNHIQVLKELQKKLTRDSKHLIILDSLAIIELLYPDATYKTLYELVFAGNRNVQLLAVLHTDVLPSSNVVLKYEQLASTNIILRKKSGIAEMTVRHRKHSGKVSESVQQVFIDENKKIVTKEVEVVKDSSKPSVDTDWTNKDVTFKLSLEDKEIQDRSKLILPYVRTADQTNSSKIIYEPDASDDWDEEDPDDDLDF